jgi:N utilization substance protein B
MGIRRDARERAVQFLFQWDVNPPDDLEAALSAFWDSRRGTVDEEVPAEPGKEPPTEAAPPSADELAIRLFADPLIRGTIEQRTEVDALIQKVAKNWDIRRMAIVDRNVLRLAIFEMLHRTDIPPVVAINEAIEIAKRFSTEDSGKFVNGILDKIREGLPRDARGATDSREGTD